MIISRLEDLAAICGAESPGELWRYLVSGLTIRAELNDFDALVAFENLHGDGQAGALLTAAPLCTDPRWRRVTTSLIALVEESGALTAAELDALAEDWVFDDLYGWPVPASWLTKGHPAAVLERRIPSPLRRWAAARISRQEPARCADVLARVQTLDGRAGDAVMGGLLDVCEGFVDEARDLLIELGCGWGSGNVRLRALRLLAVRELDRAMALARADPSNSVRSQANRLVPAQATFAVAASGPPSSPSSSPWPPSDQMALFG